MSTPYSFEFQSTQTWGNSAKLAFDRWMKSELEKKQFSDIRFEPTGKYDTTAKVVFCSELPFERVKADVIDVLDNTGHMDFRQERETIGDITHYHSIKAE